jgi:hypothetical protein
LLPNHLRPWDALLKGSWPADAGPIPDQDAVNMARRLLEAFDERSRRPDLAIIMYCRPGSEVREGAFLRRERLAAPQAIDDPEFEAERWRYTVREKFGDNAFVQLTR